MKLFVSNYSFYIRNSLAIRNKEVADMINAIEELKKRNQDLENQIKR